MSLLVLLLTKCMGIFSYISIGRLLIDTRECLIFYFLWTSLVRVLRLGTEDLFAFLSGNEVPLGTVYITEFCDE